jgi:hypothetical protein
MPGRLSLDGLVMFVALPPKEQTMPSFASLDVSRISKSQREIRSGPLFAFR